MKKVWITSDHHFNHKNIIKYCGRPFIDVNDMNEKLIEKWNELVDNDDIVIHLGDFILGFYPGERINSILERLNGQISLIVGNHDNAICDALRKKGFSVMKSFSIGDIFFSHYPAVQSDGYYDKHRERAKKEFIESKCNFVVHGHTHSVNHPNHEKHFNVAVDRNNFELVNFDYIDKYFHGASSKEK